MIKKIILLIILFIILLSLIQYVSVNKRHKCDLCVNNATRFELKLMPIVEPNVGDNLKLVYIPLK